MENILIPIIVVALMIVSVARKSKKDEKSRPVIRNPFPSTEWEEVAGELLKEEPQVQTVGDSESRKGEQPASFMKQENKETKPQTFFINPQDVEKQDSPMRHPYYEKQTDKSEMAFDLPLTDSDDLKKAVLYSEILNRKY